MEREARLFMATLGLAAWGAGGQDPGVPELLQAFRRSQEREVRASAFERLLAADPASAGKLKAVVDPILAEGERAYAALLGPKIRSAYLERLGKLGEEQVRKVLAVRRLWKDYLLHGGDRENFREAFLNPVQEMAALLQEEAVRHAAWPRFRKRYESSVYAQAVAQKDPVAFFVARNPAAKNYGYSPVMEAGR